MGKAEQGVTRNRLSTAELIWETLIKVIHFQPALCSLASGKPGLFILRYSSFFLLFFGLQPVRLLSWGSMLSVCRSEEVGKSGSACSTLAAAAVSRRFWRPAHTLLSLPPHTFCSQLPPYAPTLSLPSSLSVCVSPSLPSSLSLSLSCSPTLSTASPERLQFPASPLSLPPSLQVLAEYRAQTKKAQENRGEKWKSVRWGTNKAF